MMYGELPHRTETQINTSIRPMVRVHRDECVYVVHDIDITSCFSGARGSTDLSFERMVIGSSPELTWGKDNTGYKDDSLVEAKVERNKITFQHPRRTPVEVKRTLSNTISKGQSLLATALTAAASAST